MTAASVKATPTPPDTLLRLPDVLARIPVSRSTWWAGVKSGRYPAAVKLGPALTCWRKSEIDKLIGTP